MRAKRATTKARLFVTGAAAVFMLAGCMDSHNLVAPDEAAVNLSRDNASNIIPGRFIVTVRPGADPAAVAESYGVDPQYVYSRVMNGFAGSISDAARSGLLRDSRVLRVTPDKEIFEDPMADFPVSRRGNGARFSQADLEGIMNPAGPTPLLSLYQERIQLLAGALTRSVAGVLSGPPAAWASTIGALSLASTTPTSDLTVQEDAPWALDRIDQRALPLDGEYGYADDGAGVTVYVISSGIRDSHSEIAGRVTLGRDLVWEDLDRGLTDEENAGPDEGMDCIGTGTFAAGLVGGETYGVAKKADMVSVRIFGCHCGSTLARVIEAFEWIAEDAEGKDATILFMATGGAHPSNFLEVDVAMEKTVRSGVSVTLIAGDNQDDGCNRWPSLLDFGMTVGGTTADDRRTERSNYGDCVDWYAPASNITSASHTGDVDTRTDCTGCSGWAAALNAGVAALYLDKFPQSTPGQVFDGLRTATTKDAVIVEEPVYHHRNGRLLGYEETIDGDLLYSHVQSEGVEPEPDPTPLAPTGLKAEGISPSEIRLTWTDNSDGKASFQVQRYIDVETQFDDIATVGPGVTTFTDTGLSSSTSYLYQVRAVSGDHVSSWTNLVSTYTQPAEDDAALSVKITRVDCPNREPGKCFFETETEGPVNGWTWSIKPEGDYRVSSWQFLHVWFTDPGDYTATVTVTSDFSEPVKDSRTVRCRMQGGTLRCGEI